MADTAVALAGRVRLHPIAARLSSTYNEHCGADNCVDGDHIGSQNCLSAGSSLCHTKVQDNPWLSIDFGEPHQLDAVAVYNRINCCWERLGSFEVWVGSSLESHMEAQCARANVSATVGPFIERCDAMARVVTVLLPGAERVLNLQEVSVYELAKPPPPPGAPPRPPTLPPGRVEAQLTFGQFFLAVFVCTVLVLLVLATGRHVSSRWRRAREGRANYALELQPMQSFDSCVVAAEVVTAEVEHVPLAHQDSAAKVFTDPPLEGAVASPSWLSTGGHGDSRRAPAEGATGQ